MASELRQYLTPSNVLTGAAAVSAAIIVATLVMMIAGASPKKGAVSAMFPVDQIEVQSPNLSALTARPLFSPDRRRVATSAQNIVEQTGALTPKGTSITARGRAAVFAGPSGPVVLREGEERFGVKVLRVERESVEMEVDGVRRRVKLGSS